MNMLDLLERLSRADLEPFAEQMPFQARVDPMAFLRQRFGRVALWNEFASVACPGSIDPSIPSELALTELVDATARQGYPLRALALIKLFDGLDPGHNLSNQALDRLLGHEEPFLPASQPWATELLLTRSRHQAAVVLRGDSLELRAAESASEPVEPGAWLVAWDRRPWTGCPHGIRLTWRVDRSDVRVGPGVTGPSWILGPARALSVWVSLLDEREPDAQRVCHLSDIGRGRIGVRVPDGTGWPSAVELEGRRARLQLWTGGVASAAARIVTCRRESPNDESPLRLQLELHGPSPEFFEGMKSVLREGYGENPIAGRVLQSFIGSGAAVTARE